MSAIDHIRKALEAEKADEIHKNGSGAAQDWADYKRRVGKIQGLDAALRLLDDAKRQLQRDGDLDGDT